MIEYMSCMYTTLKRWMKREDVTPKRKRLLDNNDNFDHAKRLKLSLHQPSNVMDPSEIDAIDVNPFSSRGHMMLSLARKKDAKQGESKSASWKSTMKENCLEISSDEDDDVIVVSEKRNRPPLMPSTQYVEGNQSQSKSEEADIVQNNISTRPINNLPLHCSTPAACSQKPISRFCPSTSRRVLSSNTSSSISKMRQSSASRIGRTSSGTFNLLSKTRTITAEINMLDKEKYRALLNSIIPTHTRPSFPKPFLNL
ncbi:uncharacterized protein LOC111043625 isoform X1 [Nilaparvata lugens]|uniref:uncharacterized protein LOC111043625 isoform X2 n=1 Tax=Nilaparvata lugens TaxID=108931 RepID=UPI00193CDF1E|nr:uncharacterized protein LOC111043625 isoform X2 [Nilaparvata lugens]XP_039280459.1 uncharacterized protein LOC111043625 isoform X1 [Nilaparvata lugens]